MNNPHQRNLRKGRYSLSNQIYHITFTTKQRKPIFKNLTCARIVVNELRTVELEKIADTLAFVIMGGIALAVIVCGWSAVLRSMGMSLSNDTNMEERLTEMSDAKNPNGSIVAIANPLLAQQQTTSHYAPPITPDA